jgi:hypothetical protein
MAKRKHVALFEVIQKDKRFNRPGGTLPAPAWFKSKPAAPVDTPPVAKPIIQEPAGVIQQDSTDSWPVASSSEMPAPLDSGPRKKIVHANSPFTPASVGIICAAAFLVLLVGLTIRHFRHHPGPAETALNGPAHPEVLNVGPTIETRAPAPQVPAQQANTASSTEGPTRQANMAYVLVRSYANLRTANEICQYLTANGIPCTVEHNLVGVEAHFYTVLGLTPFSSGGTPEYAAYVQRMKQVLASLPGATQITKSIEPRLFRWGRAT